MTELQQVFLDLIRTGTGTGRLTDPKLSQEQWAELLTQAQNHKLLPLVLDAACDLRSFRESRLSGGLPPAWVSEVLGTEVNSWQECALAQISRQIVQENEFLNLILALRERGLEPLVMKGPVLRALWPKPLLRPSVDDDLLVPPEQVTAYHEAMLELGLTSDDPETVQKQGAEISYHRPGSPLYIELHRALFDQSVPALRGWNDFFSDAISRAVPFPVQDLSLLTLAPQDHLLFLLLHAFKHFLFSGFGLRVAADICLFARQYAGELDMARIRKHCAACRCERFAAAVFRIGEKYLDIPAPAAFAEIDVDETALLADMLDAGVHGAEIDRLHSANITLAAVADQNAGRSRSGGLKNTLFLPAAQLSGRYPWLKKRPWLLPAAWANRTADYLANRIRRGKQNPMKSLRIGQARVRLLEEYGVIDKK